MPLQSYFIAQNSMFDELGLKDTRLALILPYTAMGLPLAVYLLKVFLDSLPDELFDAARLDGCGDLRMFTALVLPLLKPGLATVAIFSALNAWNEFLLALLYISDDALKTLPTGPARLLRPVHHRLPAAVLGAEHHHACRWSRCT